MNLRPALIVATLLACGNSREPQRQAAEVAPVDAAPQPAAPSDAAVDAGPVWLVDARPEMLHPPLPSGDYEVTTELKTDTCSKADSGIVAPAPVTLFVHMKVYPDKATGKPKVIGNFPLPLPRVKWMGFGSARSDIALDPPAGAQPFTSKDPKCPAYETKTVYRVIEVIGDQVKIEYSRDFGDASSCTAKTAPPSKCGLQYVYTYKLVNKVCNARCGVSYIAKGADGGVQPKCDCPDAGAF